MVIGDYQLVKITEIKQHLEYLARLNKNKEQRESSLKEVDEAINQIKTISDKCLAKVMKI